MESELALRSEKEYHFYWLPWDPSFPSSVPSSMKYCPASSVSFSTWPLQTMPCHQDQHPLHNPRNRLPRTTANHKAYVTWINLSSNCDDTKASSLATSHYSGRVLKFLLSCGHSVKAATPPRAVHRNRRSSSGSRRLCRASTGTGCTSCDSVCRGSRALGRS